MTEVSRGAGTPGPASFATALRAAIEARGMGLEQIQRRLGRQGHDVSLAALSYWRSGRSRPSRKPSLDAVAALEPILGLTPGSLTDLLPDGAVIEAGPVGGWPLDPVLAGLAPGRLSPRLAALLAGGREQVELVSDHQSVVLDGDRCAVARTRRIYRALADGVDRILVATSLPDGGPGEPGLVANGRGRPVDRAVLADHGVVLTELALDATLRRGEAIMLELDLDRSVGMTTGTPRELCGSAPLRELVVEVRFDPRALPQQVEWYESGADAAAESITALPLDANASLLVVRHDLRAPRHGVRWTWDPPAG